MNSRIPNLTNQKFDRWTVIDFIEVRDEKAHWLCVCECGNKGICSTGNLRQGRTRSCGCRQSESVISRNNKHGECRRDEVSPEFTAFAAAKGRCTNPNDSSFNRYGGRGIEFRLPSVVEMVAAIGRRPSPEHSLNRINNDGHYEIGNIEWATCVVQSNNRSSNRTLTVNGITDTAAGWARRTGLQASCIYQRIAHGYCAECVVSLPWGGKCLHK
jgi:hypothetical protein